ncbi:hypothetical protein, partial [Enterococcus faecium]|uniref:hypothetical protein n=1 Tax=Enterococcus faecium TaxID=1352 RepID=UPI0031CDA0B5
SMSLPVSPLATGSVDINGTPVPLRSLSRAEAIKLQTFRGRADEAEPFILSCATGVTVEEATAWLASVNLETGG